MISLLELFSDVDDFMQTFLPFWKQKLLESGSIQRRRKTRLSESEIMTILIAFHQSHYRNFKAYYQKHVQAHLTSEFPQLVSYTRFVELMPRVLIPLLVYLQQQKGVCTGISFIDSTPSKSVTIGGLRVTRCFQPWQRVEKRPWVGSSASNCIWWSMSAESCWLFECHPAISMIASRFRL